MSCENTSRNVPGWGGLVVASDMRCELVSDQGLFLYCFVVSTGDEIAVYTCRRSISDRCFFSFPYFRKASGHKSGRVESIGCYLHVLSWPQYSKDVVESRGSIVRF